MFIEFFIQLAKVKGASKPSKPSKGQRSPFSLSLEGFEAFLSFEAFEAPFVLKAFEGFEGFEALKGGLNICLVSFSSYLFFFVFNPQKRSRVAFSFFRLERTLASF